MGGKKKDAKEKPLEKMTATELREIAKDIPDIMGVHGKNKSELISEIKKEKKIKEVVRKSSKSVREIKKNIRSLKSLRQAALRDNDAKMAVIYRKRISRLKKKTRQAA